MNYYPFIYLLTYITTKYLNEILILIELSRQCTHDNKTNSTPLSSHPSSYCIDRFHKIIKENICKQKAEGKILFIILNITTDLVLYGYNNIWWREVWNVEISKYYVYKVLCICLSIFIQQWILHWIYTGNRVTFSARMYTLHFTKKNKNWKTLSLWSFVFIDLEGKKISLVFMFYLSSPL